MADNVELICVTERREGLREQGQAKLGEPLLVQQPLGPDVSQGYSQHRG